MQAADDAIAARGAPDRPDARGGPDALHYRSFDSCPTRTVLQSRIDAELPEYRRYGIHVMVSQNGAGELVIGDSHEYGNDIEPFDKARIDTLVLQYLDRFFDLPSRCMAAHWHGCYVKHPTRPYRAATPAPGVVAVTGLGGHGVTMSFGVADDIIRSTPRLVGSGQWAGTPTPNSQLPTPNSQLPKWGPALAGPRASLPHLSTADCRLPLPTAHCPAQQEPELCGTSNQ